jgi:hypothetical protein
LYANACEIPDPMSDMCFVLWVAYNGTIC